MVAFAVYGKKMLHGTLRQERRFRLNPWAYAHEHCFPAGNVSEPSFDVSAAVRYFTDTYSDSTEYQTVPDWILQDLPTSFDTPFDETPITPGLVRHSPSLFSKVIS